MACNPGIQTVKSINITTNISWTQAIWHIVCTLYTKLRTFILLTVQSNLDTQLFHSVPFPQR